MIAINLYFDPKSPEDIAPYSLNFGEWLTPATTSLPADIIVTATCSTSNPTTPSDTTLIATGADISTDGSTVTTTLSGGTANNVYRVHYLITTQNGITIQRSGTVQVFER